jgi:Phage integrase, N-terminal SAM-like domain
VKLVDQYEAACKVRRAARTILTYRRWVEEFLRFHHDRSGRWIDPKDMGEPEVEAFLIHLAINRCVASIERCSHESGVNRPAERPPELATGFELPNAQKRKKLRQRCWNARTSRRAI